MIPGHEAFGSVSRECFAELAVAKKGRKQKKAGLDAATKLQADAAARMVISVPPLPPLLLLLLLLLWHDIRRYLVRWGVVWALCGCWFWALGAGFGGQGGRRGYRYMGVDRYYMASWPLFACSSL